MTKKKEPQARERELLEESAQLVADWIRSDPQLVTEIKESYEAAGRGEGTPVRQVIKKPPPDWAPAQH